MASFARATEARMRALEEESEEESDDVSPLIALIHRVLEMRFAATEKTVRKNEMISETLERSYEGVVDRLCYRADQGERGIGDCRGELGEAPADPEARNAEVAELSSLIERIDRRALCGVRWSTAHHPRASARIARCHAPHACALLLGRPQKNEEDR